MVDIRHLIIWSTANILIKLLTTQVFKSGKKLMSLYNLTNA